MEGIEKPHVDKYKELTNNWNYDASCTAASLPVWDLENFKHLICCTECTYGRYITGTQKLGNQQRNEDGCLLGESP
jgi:hypothetical protein